MGCKLRQVSSWIVGWSKYQLETAAEVPDLNAKAESLRAKLQLEIQIEKVMQSLRERR